MIFAGVLYAFYHAHKDRTYIYELSLLLVTVRARRVFLCPVCDAVRAEQLVVAGITLNWATFL